MPSRSRSSFGRLPEKLVWWTSPTPDGFGGKSFADATEIDGRWEQRQKLYRDAEGRELMSNAVVYVGIDVAVGDFLMLGEISDLSSGAEDPDQQPTAYEVVALETIKDVQGRKVCREVLV